MSLETLVRNAKRKAKNLFLGATLLTSSLLYGCGGKSADTPPVVNNAPNITLDVQMGTSSGNPITSVYVNEGDMVKIQTGATDVDGDYPILIGVSGLPGWATFDAGTGIIKGVPSSTDGDGIGGSTTTPVTVQGIDSEGATTDYLIDLTVNNKTLDRILCNSDRFGSSSATDKVVANDNWTGIAQAGAQTGGGPRFHPLDSTKITTSKLVGGNVGIYIEDLVGGTNQQLITDSLPITSYGASLNSTANLVFTDDNRNGYRAIQVSGWDGSVSTNIGKLTSNTNEERTPVESNGWVYYSANKSGQFDICRMKADRTGIEENLTNTSTSDEYYPDISPDGTKIIYSVDDGSTIYQLWNKNSDGTGTATQITNLSGDGSADISGSVLPNYSSDGKKIAFSDFSLTGSTLNYSDVIILYKDNADNWSESRTVSDGTYNYIVTDYK